MRILYVINGFDAGGAEHGLLTLLENDAFHGNEIHVLALCRGRGPLAAHAEQRLGDRLRFASTRESLDLVACAVGAAALVASMLTLRPAFLVLSLKQANVIGRAVALLFPRVRCVAFEHIVQYRARRLQGLYAPLLRLLSGRVDDVWADCSETLTATRSNFSPRPRGEHVIPLFAAEPARRAKLDYAMHTPVRVGAAGRLVARKNLAVLIEVLAVLRDEHGVEAVLEIFGDGPEREELQRRAAAASLQEQVTFRGYQSDWLLRAVECDIFVNLGDTEGFCIAVAEAMVIGLPVVAVDVGGIRDYGRDGDNMLKLEAPSADATRRAMLSLVQSTPLRQRLGERARADMLSAYGPATLREQVSRALASPPRGRRTR